MPINSERRVLITGAGGYIGPVVTEHLLGLGYKVRALDVFLYPTRSVLEPYFENGKFDLVTGDHCDGPLITGALDGVTDVVILSGLVGDPITRKYPNASKKINDEGMRALAGLFRDRGLDRVIFVSTCSNYGLIKDAELVGEDFELKPLSLYAQAKVAMEQELLGLKGKVDFHPIILRFATAFGLAPRMRFDLTVSQFVHDMYLGRELQVYDAKTWRPYCHVRDFGDLIQRVLEAPAEAISFEVFNSGGDINNFTKQMIVNAILESLSGAKVAYRKDGPDPRNYRVDFAKVRDRLRFEPSRTVRDGIGELIEAYGQNRFTDVDDRPNFYGNHEIDYPLSN